MYVQVISELNAQVLGSVSLSLSYFFLSFWLSPISLLWPFQKFLNQ